MEVLILGGGVVGVTTAYQLLKDGHQVLVIGTIMLAGILWVFLPGLRRSVKLVK